jgi:peptidoglycan/LPS O-acetylase OafA/YrhL
LKQIFVKCRKKIILIPSKPRYQELDALRGIAALMVVLFHFTMVKDRDTIIFKLGTTGVDLFFIISGFVIFMSLKTHTGARKFIINRLVRLYPTYWVAVTFTFALFISVRLYRFGTDIDFVWQLKRYLANLTIFQHYFKMPDIDAPYWTLLIEMLFYAAILIIYLLKLLNNINAIGLIVCVSTVTSALFFNDVYLVKIVFKYMPLVLFTPLFLAGINFYKIYNKNSSAVLNYLIAAFCIVCQIMLFENAGRSKGYINVTEYAMMLSLYFVAFTAFINHQLMFIVNRITLFFGKISYALYVIHEYISIKIIIPVFINKLHVNFWIAALFVALPVVIILATLITFYVEIPLSRKLKKRLYKAA